MQKNRGYTLLFAVLVSSVVLSVGISILTISKKEFLLSSSARESVLAFYAADAGLECAQYHEDNTSDFSTTTAPTRVMSPGCMAQTPRITITGDVGGIPNSYLFEFQLSLQNNNNACAKVSVYKKFIQNNTSGNWISTTTVTSRGYNLGWDADRSGHPDGPCSVSSPRRVERAIEYTY